MNASTSEQEQTSATIANAKEEAEEEVQIKAALHLEM